MIREANLMAEAARNVAMVNILTMIDLREQGREINIINPDDFMKEMEGMATTIN